MNAVHADGGAELYPDPLPPSSEEQFNALVAQLEDSLRQVHFERGRWRATVESMLDPVVVGDAQGVAVYTNPAFNRMVGYSVDAAVPAEMQATQYRLRRPDGTLYDYDELPLRRASCLGEEIADAEVLLETASGERRLVVWSVSPLRAADGSLIGAVGVGRDITQQRAAEETRARLAAIVESSQDAIIGKAMDGTITSWNGGAERLYGYTAAEVVGQSIGIIIPPERAEELPRMMGTLARGERIDRHETIRVRKDGQRITVSVSVSPVRDGHGDVIGAATIARDVTERKRAEQGQRFLGEVSATLAGSLDFCETLERVARLPVPALADLCIVDMVDDHSARQRVARGRDGAGRWMDAVQVAYSLDAEVPHPVWEVLRTGEARYLATATPGEDSAPEGFETLAAALAGVGVSRCLVLPLVIRGRPAGAVSLLSTAPRQQFDPERVELAREFASRASVAIDNARLYKEAKEAVRARDEFLSVAAHELKTPMTSLRGFVQLAMRQIERDGVLDPAQAWQSLRVIDLQSKRLANLVGQLLDVSRLDAGRLSLERRVTDLTYLVQGVVATAKAMGADHPIDLEAPPALLALVDTMRIEQVIAGLLDNACKFSPPGSPVEVVLTQPTKDCVQLTVRDYGAGVPEEHRTQMFTRFYHGQATEQSGGMGLGLYVAREIVVLHGGNVEAEFPEEGGSRFTVTLPTGLE